MMLLIEVFGDNLSCWTFDALSRDVTGFSANTSQSSAAKGLEHRVHISAPVINFITPAYKPGFKATVHGGSSIEGKFAASGGLEFSRKDMALESTSNSSSLGFSLSGGSLMSGGIGSATVSASIHDSSDVKSALSGFDEAAERANVEAAGGSYDISRVKEEKHSSGFDFSVDAIGLAGMMGGGGNSSTFSVPFEASVEKDGDKSTFFMTSGNLGEAVLETANNFADAAKDMGRFGESFMSNPGEVASKLLSPLKGLVDEIGDRIGGNTPKPAFKQTFVATVDSDGEEYEDITIEEFEKPAAKAPAVETEEDDAELAKYFVLSEKSDEDVTQDELFEYAKEIVASKLGREKSDMLFDPGQREELLDFIRSSKPEKSRYIDDRMEGVNATRMANGDGRVTPRTEQSLRDTWGETYDDAIVGGYVLDGLEFISDLAVKGVAAALAGETYAARMEQGFDHTNASKVAFDLQESIEVAAAIGSITKTGKQALKAGFKSAIKASAGVAKVATKVKASMKPGATLMEFEGKFWNTDKVVVFEKTFKKSGHVQANKVYQRSDLIDPMRVDKWGVSSIDRMKKGLAPVGPDGEFMNLHHMLQETNSPLAEVTQSFHKKYHGELHIWPNGGTGGVSRANPKPTVDDRIYRSWRESYWKNRAKDFE